MTALDISQPRVDKDLLLLPLPMIPLYYFHLQCYKIEKLANHRLSLMLKVEHQQISSLVCTCLELENSHVQTSQSMEER